MTKAEMQRVMQSCEYHDIISTRCHWAAHCDKAKTVFCLHRDMFDAFAHKLAPLLVHTAMVRVHTQRRNFVLFAIVGWDQAYAVSRRIAEIGNAERRRARLADAEGHHLSEHYRVLWQIQAGCCYYSGVPLGRRFEDREFTIDHIEPLATRPIFGGLPGTDWPINLALVTRQMNSMKGADSVETFLRNAKKHAWFTPTTTTHRRQMDRKRREAFRAFMIEHCPNEEDWR